MGERFTVTLPDIGEGVVEGEVVEWLKQVGDPLEQDEPVVVVMTDKATVELPAPHPGKLAKQYYQPGETALLDHPLYDIELKGKAPAVKEKGAEAPLKAEAAPLPTAKPIPTPTGGKVLATPSTRKLARDLGIDISTVTGTGNDGRVLPEDLRGSRGVVEAIPRLPDDEEQPLIGVRKLMARKMARAKGTIPHFSYFEQIDAARLVQLYENFKKDAAKEGIRVTYLPFLVRALSLTLKEYPIVNSALDGETLVIHHHHNIGIAMTSEQGLIVPVLKNVETLSMQDIVRACERLKQSALAGELQPKDMQEGTITISNFGVLGGGGRWATPVINYPEAAIVAVAKVKQQPFVRNGELVVCDTLNLSWSFDHRIIDGAQAAACSHHFSTLLQNPASLL